MSNVIKGLCNIIRLSLYKGEDKPSSSRIFSYVMMSIIFLLGITQIVIEIGNAIIVWRQGNGSTYVPSWQSITIIAMWLAHQLTLLGIYKSAEVKIPSVVNNPKNVNIELPQNFAQEPKFTQTIIDKPYDMHIDKNDTRMHTTADAKNVHCPYCGCCYCSRYNKPNQDDGAI